MRLFGGCHAVLAKLTKFIVLHFFLIMIMFFALGWVDYGQWGISYENYLLELSCGVSNLRDSVFPEVRENSTRMRLFYLS
jgi:hypothetical protein